MGLAQVYRKQLAIYHASLGWSSDLWCGLEMPQIWDCLTRSLQELKASDFGFEVQVFVLMGTHAHLLFSSRRGLEQYAIEELVKLALKNKPVNKKTLETNSGLVEFERPYFIETVDSFRQLLNVHKYIYRNPVEAGLSQNVEDYPYSTLGVLLGRLKSQLIVVDMLHVVQDPCRILKWLNQSPSAELYGWSSLKSNRNGF